MIEIGAERSSSISRCYATVRRRIRQHEDATSEDKLYYLIYLFSYNKSSDAISVPQECNPNKRLNLSYFQLCSCFWKLSKVLIGHNSEN